MQKGGLMKTNILETNLSIGGVSLVQKMLFAKHLSMMLKSGIAITDALRLLYNSSRGKFRLVIGGIYSSVKAGQPLASALAKYPHIFSSFFHGSILAGEASGNLENNLDNIAVQLKKDKELNDKIKSALFYPVIVLIVALAMGLFISFYILPKIVPMLAGLKINLPWTTKILIALSSFVQSYGLALVIIIVGLIIFLPILVKQKWTQPFFHRLWLNLPVVGLMTKNLNLARFSLNLGVLLKSGLTITEALKLTADSLTNYYYQQALINIKKAVDKGAKLSVNMNNYNDYFPELAIRMIKIGEESGRLEETLLYLADFFETEVDSAAKNLSIAVEPILLVFIGLVVGFLAIAIITPIYSITGGVIR